MGSKSSNDSIPSQEEIYRRKGWKIPKAFHFAPYFTWIPLFLIALILLTTSMLIPVHLIIYGIENYQGWTGVDILDLMLLCVILASSYLIFGICLLIFGPIVKWILGIFSHQREGDYPFLSPVAGYWSVVNGIILFNRHLFLEITRTTFLLVLFYRAMGMKIGRKVIINSTYLHDPDLVTIGDNVTIGGDAMILGHLGDRQVLHLRKVVIGNRVDIGQDAILMPGVVVGEGSIVGACSLVTKGTRIPPNEVWAGSPARRIARIQRS